jgi:radical SAM superfamily enzyme YgiQ (UPF0313 family)
MDAKRMKITLLNIESQRPECVNKDFMGGYGWAFSAGNSLRARLINLVKKRGEKIPVMSFGYLASIFSQNGHKVEVISNKIPKSDLVIIHSTMVDYRNEVSWAKRIRESTKAKIGFLGPFASSVPEAFLGNCDFIIKGEPEDICMRIKENWIPEGIVESKPIADLDSLPFPRWDLFPVSEYSYLPAIKERPFLPILSSRGCLYTCSYCPYKVSYDFRERTVDNVLKEIEYLIKKFNVKGLLFRDPLFALNKKRAKDIALGIIANRYTVKWACETRLDLLDEDLLDIFYKSGLRVINVGIESSNEDVIKKATRKPIEIKHQERIIRYCDRLGIRVTVFYMLGLPDDTEETIKHTIRYAKRLNTHVAQFFIFTLFPGTKYYEEMKGQGQIVEQDWQKFDCYTPIFRHRNLSGCRLLELKEKAFVSYYFRPKWIMKFSKRLLKDILT